MKRDIFQAIGDPTRRAILVLLATQSMTPTTMAEQFVITRQAVSKHIKVLAECNVISPVVSGREIYYQLNPKAMKELADWIEPFRKLWEARFHQLDTLLNDLQRNKS